MSKIKVEQAESFLRKMRRGEGVRLRNPDAETFWRVYKGFTKISVEVDTSEDDALLFQWGAYGISLDDGFSVDFTRQFCINDADGEYEHMEQLGATLRFAAGAGSNIRPGNFWSYNFNKSFERFIEAVEQSQVFKQVVTKHQAYRLDIVQEEV